MRSHYNHSRNKAVDYNKYLSKILNRDILIFYLYKAVEMRFGKAFLNIILFHYYYDKLVYLISLNFL